MTGLRTSRLVMRRWAAADREPFAALNADPEVMRHFPSALTPAESDALVDRFEEHFEQHGFGLWALEALDSGDFVGFTGLQVPRFHVAWMDARAQPVVEVGWRLARSAWGHGYATEAGQASLDHAFSVLALPEVVSFTTTGNLRSQAVMRRGAWSRSPPTTTRCRGGTRCRRWRTCSPRATPSATGGDDAGRARRTLEPR